MEDDMPSASRDPATSFFGAAAPLSPGGYASHRGGAGDGGQASHPLSASHSFPLGSATPGGAHPSSSGGGGATTSGGSSSIGAGDARRAKLADYHHARGYAARKQGAFAAAVEEYNKALVSFCLVSVLLFVVCLLTVFDSLLSRLLLTLARDNVFGRLATACVHMAAIVENKVSFCVSCISCTLDIPLGDFNMPL